MEGAAGLLACLACILSMGECPTPYLEWRRCSQNPRYSLLSLNLEQPG